MTVLCFRVLVTTNAIVFVAWLVSSFYGSSPSYEVSQVLRWNGFDGIVSATNPLFLWIPVALRVISLIGMFFSISMSRWLFWLCVLIPLALSPFMGLGVYRAAEAFWGLLLALIDGALALALALMPVNRDHRY